MNTERIRTLFIKHLSSGLSPQEQAELEQGLQSLDEQTFSAWVDEFVDVNKDAEFSKKDEVFAKIEAQMDQQPVRPIGASAPWYTHVFARVAAILVLVTLSISLLYTGYMEQSGEQLVVLEDSQGELTLPEKEAMVTLADGTSMLFSAGANDSIHHKGIDIMRLADGTLMMRQESMSNPYFEEDDRHLFTAPKGVSLRVLLPDSSIVLLNSGSSISVLASYGKKTRAVELDGEAYFDVSHRKDKPFFVTAKNTTIRVLGTQFNLSAYKQDNEVQTTLIQGEVNVSSAANNMLLKPGQQAVIKGDASMKLHKDVNISQVLAWKEGYFRFHDQPISEIMKELAKWYPIEGIDMRAGTDDKFTGSLKRSKKLTDLLHAMEQVSELNFVIQERRVVVMK